MYDRSTHRMHFSGVDAPKRTAKNFKAGRYNSHSKNSTILIALTYFDIIDDIPTTDRLHLIDLGVMRFLMRSWKKGTFGKNYKWTLDDISFISSIMETVKLPSEVPRIFNFGKVPNLRISCTTPAAYEHFKLFFCAVTIFSSPAHKQHYELAHEMLLKFVRSYATLYGDCFVTSNVHNLKHIYEDVCRFGSLDEYSTYIYESALYLIKHMIRTGNNIMPQVINRIKELARMVNELNSVSQQDSHQCPVILNKASGVTLPVRSNFMLRKGDHDGWFMLKNNLIMKFAGAVQTSDGILCVEAITRPLYSVDLKLYLF